jgi:NADH-quinone oxidoreductase subunit L
METMEIHGLWLLPVIPLIGGAINGLFGAKIQRRWGGRPVGLLAIGASALSFAAALIYFVKLAGLAPEHRGLLCHCFDWIRAGGFTVPMAFWLDPLSGLMVLMITFVGTLIHVYSAAYMRGDAGTWRFFSFLNLFLAAMLTLVLADNFALMFVGWEGVGLCSYLLIGFWYKDLNNARAGLKAFVTNRVGDIGLVLGVAALFWSLGGGWNAAMAAPEHAERMTLVFREVQAQASFLAGTHVLGMPAATLVCLLLLWAATAKSAQIPLYVWLPDAMAGPTPVSALIHAATMVTAGVYLIARTHFLFALSPAAMTAAAVTGACTALFAATIGLFQHDIKKVLAYSTISQLGLMFMAVGAGAFASGIFHLITHAFFKACLFLGAGSVIHAMHGALGHSGDRKDLDPEDPDPQDLRNMGGLGRFMPRTRFTYLAACLAISGFPVLSGFFSKDEILWKTFTNANTLVSGRLLWIIGALASFLTAFYMFRSYFKAFSGTFRSGPEAERKLHESPASMTGVLGVLAVFSVIAGWIGLPVLWRLPNWIDGWLDPVFEGSRPLIRWHEASHSSEWGMLLASTAVALAGFGLAALLYRNGRSSVPAGFVRALPRLHRFIYRKYYVDELYGATAIAGTRRLSELCDATDSRAVDGLVNGIGTAGRRLGSLSGLNDSAVVDGAVNGIAAITGFAGRMMRLAQNGRVQTYLYVFTGGAAVAVLARALFFH